MNTENKQVQHSLNDLIQIARDGGTFYGEAAGKVDNPQLSSLFNRMAMHKREIVDGLASDVVTAGGTPAGHGTMVGAMHQLYGKARAALGDPDVAYVAELEASEDRLLEAFKDALADPDTPAAAKMAIEQHLPRVVECHAIMRDHKQALGSAH